MVLMVLMAMVMSASAVFVANDYPVVPDVPVESPAPLSRKFEHDQYRELVKDTVLLLVGWLAGGGCRVGWGEDFIAYCVVHFEARDNAPERPHGDS